MWIWNYTPVCQFDNIWDEYTTVCRGLITNQHGEILYRPFPKFFNLGQREETMLANLPAEIPQFREKLDGSLGIIYELDGLVHVATRGSFVSEQAQWATKWIQLQMRIKPESFLPRHTYLGEIIYPGNRIVVDYKGLSELVLLAVIDTETGLDMRLVEAAFCRHRSALCQTDACRIAC